MKKAGNFFNKLLMFLSIAWLVTVGLESYNVKNLAKGVVALAPNSAQCYDYTYRLNEQQKVLYNQMLEQIQAGKLKVKSELIKELPTDEVVETTLAILDDHPEFFWLKHGYRVEPTNKRVTFEAYNYLGITISPEKYGNAFYNGLEHISNQVENVSGTSEKVKFAHDYLVRNISYNHKAADETSYAKLNNYTSEYAVAATSYGALVNYSAVCAGYAKGFQAVLQRNGICCGYVTGETEPGPHAWNVVNVNGNDYYFDVTWDDVGDYYQPPNDFVYTYYALDETEMEKDHKADEFYHKRN